MRLRECVTAILIAVMVGVSTARAQQAPQEARLLVTVMDPTTD